LKPPFEKVMSSEFNQSGFNIYYINLDRSAGRRERIENVLDQYGLLAERIPAFDGSQSTDAELFRHYDPNKNSSEYFAPLKKSEIAYKQMTVEVASSQHQVPGSSTPTGNGVGGNGSGPSLPSATPVASKPN